MQDSIDIHNMYGTKYKYTSLKKNHQLENVSCYKPFLVALCLIFLITIATILTFGWIAYCYTRPTGRTNDEVCWIFASYYNPETDTAALETDTATPETDTAAPETEHRPHNGPTGGVPDKCLVEDVSRFDCYPEGAINQTLCEARGCCWRLPDPLSADANVPYCYYPISYSVYELQGWNHTDFGYSANLLYNNKGYTPNPVNNVVVDVYLETSQRLHMKIYDGKAKRFEVPQDLVPRPVVGTKSPSQDYSVAFTSHPFGVQVNYKDKLLLDTSLGGFIYSDSYLQISSKLPGFYLYGIGEKRSTFLQYLNGWKRLALWDRDEPPTENANLYGSHPFMINVMDDGTAVGIAFINSGAMEFDLQPLPAFTFRAIGGIIDMYLFTGPSFKEVVTQYWDVIGRPFQGDSTGGAIRLPPYWWLGFHLCRWGYNGTAAVTDLVGRMRKAGLPQDVQWNDIDYMDRKLDFTFDRKLYAGLPDLVADLHDNHQKYVMILDPGISSEQPPGSYPPYDAGLAANAFVRDSRTGAPLVGRVWPGVTVFPDFGSAAARTWWAEQLAAFRREVLFDGVWIDMNEPSNFVDGSTTGCPSNSSLEEPYFTPDIVGGKLRMKTICASAVQQYGNHYDLHNLYGHSEIIATYEALTKLVPEEIPFILSRSTYMGSGRLANHWLGDNSADYANMRYSVAGILNFQLFGIPLVGADICGFGGVTNAELCQRWYQLGAFYPFSRSHNTIGAPAQDPLAFGDAVANSTRSVYLTRYRLLPYLHSLLYRARAHGELVVRPLVAEFPADEGSRWVEEQFLWGGALLVTPVLRQGATTVRGYFPRGEWFGVVDGTRVSVNGSGEFRLLAAPSDVINVHLRGGFVIPGWKPEITTSESQRNGYDVIVALDRAGVAKGNMCVASLNGPPNFVEIDFEVSNNSLRSVVSTPGYQPAPNAHLSRGFVYGLIAPPKSVTFHGNQLNFSFNNNILSFTTPNISLNQTILIEWSL